MLLLSTTVASRVVLAMIAGSRVEGLLLHLGFLVEEGYYYYAGL
jgi:hypothetical protein